MLIALDYDDTYTRDPEFWDDFIVSLKKRGHSIICVTMRYEQDGSDVQKALGDKVERIIFTGRKAKYDYVVKYGYMPSVWIDDMPWFILMDAKG